MHWVFAASFTLLATSVVAQPWHGPLGSTLPAVRRQTASGSAARDCNTTCDAFTDAKEACKVTHCGCNDKYLQAQGDCLVCQTETPRDEASVQFLLEAEMDQCHKEGIPIQFQLHLSPDAQAIVDEIHHQNASLRRQQTAFLALQIAGGHVGLFLVLAFTVFIRKVHRDLTFLNFCVTWIFSSVFYSILLYRGIEKDTVLNTLSFVPRTTCLAQAALINGAQVMTSCSTMALVIQLWIGLRAAIHGDISSAKQKRWTTLVLLGSPYVFFFGFAISSAFVGKTHFFMYELSVQRTLPANFYCLIVGLTPFFRLTYGVTLGLLIVAAIFDAFIIIILYRHWWAFRHVQRKNAVSLPTLFRVVVFSTYRVVVAVAYGTVLNRPPDVSRGLSEEALFISDSVPIWVDMLQAAIPLVGFIIFGTNSALLQEIPVSLMFWRRSEKGFSTTHQKNNITNRHDSAVNTNHDAVDINDNAVDANNNAWNGQPSMT